MKTKTMVNRIVNDYLKWEHWCEVNNFSKDDDDHYALWLKLTSEKTAKQLYNDLSDLCEDNEIMKEAIKKYLGVNQDEDNNVGQVSGGENYCCEDI